MLKSDEKINKKWKNKEKYDKYDVCFDVPEVDILTE